MSLSSAAVLFEERTCVTNQLTDDNVQSCECVIMCGVKRGFDESTALYTHTGRERETDRESSLFLLSGHIRKQHLGHMTNFTTN